MAPKTKRVELDIFGQTFSLIAENEARLREVARHVDAEMKQLSQSTATIDSFRLAVLAALNIANERFELADRLASKDNSVQAQFEALNAKAARIALELDEALRS
jgi:cell division protein ZapA